MMSMMIMMMMMTTYAVLVHGVGVCGCVGVAERGRRRGRGGLNEITVIALEIARAGLIYLHVS